MYTCHLCTVVHCTFCIWFMYVSFIEVHNCCYDWSWGGNIIIDIIFNSANNLACSVLWSFVLQGSIVFMLLYSFSFMKLLPIIFLEEWYVHHVHTVYIHYNLSKIFQLYVLTVWIGTYSMKINIQSMNLSEVIIEQLSLCLSYWMLWVLDLSNLPKPFNWHQIIKGLLTS